MRAPTTAESPQDRVSRELFLSTFGARLDGFDGATADRLLSLLEEEEAAPGEALFRVGETPDFFFLIREGAVALSEAERRTRRLLPGPQVFGMADCLLERPRTRSAVATSPLSLLKVPAEGWLELLDDSFDVARAMMLGFARTIPKLEVRATSERPPAPTAVGEARSLLARLPAGPLSPIERLALMMDAPLLRGAGAQALSDLVMVTEEVDCRAGDALFDAGSARDRAFFVLSGIVALSPPSPGAARMVVAGEMVGGAAALGEDRAPYTARAVEHTRALAVRVEDWCDLMEENFDLLRAALSSMAVDYERLSEEVSAVS